jgi:lipopolysaccharide/colanic/teichoic acid biosynthesis glycosyltransferase
MDVWGEGVPTRSYRGKRLLDLAIVALVALPAAVVGLLAVLAIWLDDGRPVLFLQQRAGRGGRPFVMLKLRTMHAHGRDPGGREPGGREPGGHEHSVFPDRDSFTRVGRWLRRLSVDELPQLINVARGEMSMVGPRPTLPYQVRRYDARQRRRLDVLPGLTGLAQVRGRNGLSWADRIEWDLRYIENQSIQLDLAVLACTAWAVLTGEGTGGHPRSDPIARQMER